MKTPHSILCFGDSLTWGRDPITGGRHDEQNRWPTRLQHRFGPDVRVLADGLPGRTAGPKDPLLPYPTAGAAQLALSLLVNGPVDRVLLMLGTNDLQNHLYRGVERTSEAILGLVAATQNVAPGRGWSPEIILVAPPPINRRLAAQRKPTFSEIGSRLEKLTDHLAVNTSSCGISFIDTRFGTRSEDGDGVHLLDIESRALGDFLADALSSKCFR
ncbi:GDSL-type esterase/lipase family protein [Shimia thalassica]|uniref:GDSL-type esterase/lipase family protein n=1 Tax=Shimia thalassica TaxID=1715693 RepID=UPI00329F5BF7